MNKKILVIDDEILIRNNLKEFLLDYNFQVETADNGLSGLEALKDDNFDIVFVDYMMPKMNGEEFIIQAQKIYPELPIVLISATGDTYKVIEIIKKGAFDYITKPILDMNIILKIISRIEK